MYHPTVMALAASVPWFASYLSHREQNHVSDDLICVLYFCAVGLLISFAAILDDSNNLTSWFGIAVDAY
jgi:hypothetical protein